MMDRRVSPDTARMILRDLLEGVHRLRLYEIDHDENKRLLQLFVNDMFMDERIVERIERLQLDLADDDPSPAE